MTSLSVSPNSAGASLPQKNLFSSETVIDTSQNLTALCNEILKKSSALENPFIVLDTEFLRETTYWPKLCLIQIGFQEDVWIIDPLKHAIDLTPFFRLLQEPKLLKVLHAARQDLEIFYHLSGQLPTSLFDTQIGAMVCDYKDSVGYDTLVSSFLGVTLDKSSRRTDWSQRPLSKAQLSYAADDVRYLVQVYPLMQQKIETLQRAHWVEEEMLQLSDASTYETPPELAYKRLKIKKNAPQYLEALRLMAAWREKEALQHNLARPFVAKDDVLQDLALLNPKTEQEAKNLPSLKSRPPSQQRLKVLLSLLAQAQKTPASDCPTLPMTPRKTADRQVIGFLKLLLSEISQKSGVAEKLIATSQELEDFAQEQGFSGKGQSVQNEKGLHQGWRWTLFGQQAEALLKGHLTACIKDQRLLFEKN